MKKIIFLFLICVNLAFAYTYNDVLLKAQASVFPKIMLLDKKVDDKLIDGILVYTIVYDESDYDTASDIKEFMQKKFQGYINEYSYRINIVEFSDLSLQTKASAIYALHSDEYIKKVATIAKEKGIISFSYDINNLKNGLLFSLMLEKETILYLMRENLYSGTVDFVDALFQVVKFIDTPNAK